MRPGLLDGQLEVGKATAEIVSDATATIISSQNKLALVLNACVERF